MIISWLRVKPAGISYGYMPPNNPHAFQLTPPPFFPPPKPSGKARREERTHRSSAAASEHLSPGVSPAGRGAGRGSETRSCRLHSAFFSTRQVSTSPAGSPTAVVDLHASSSVSQWQPPKRHREPQAPWGCRATLPE